MSIPFKKKLSYAWERATHKDRIYSHVFEVSKKAGVVNKPDYYMPVKSQLWLKATKIEGSDDAYKMNLCHYYTFLRSNGKPLRSSQDYYEEIPFPRAGTREQMTIAINNWEVQKLKETNTSPATKQPFKSFIKTKLFG